MVQNGQRKKSVVEKKALSPSELRRATWGSIEQIVALLMKLMFEILLDRAATEQIGAVPYERTSGRKTYRNGSYKRSLGTRFGSIEDLLVPRLREGALLHSLFAPYQQRTDDVDKALGTLFLN
jgi:transposase-like protein